MRDKVEETGAEGTTGYTLWVSLDGKRRTLAKGIRRPPGHWAAPRPATQEEIDQHRAEAAAERAEAAAKIEARKRRAAFEERPAVQAARQVQYALEHHLEHLIGRFTEDEWFDLAVKLRAPSKRELEERRTSADLPGA